MIAILGLGLLVFVIVGAAAYFVTVYNGLVMVGRNVDKSWANIDVLLKQRHDEIPKLIKVCEGYAQFERQTLEKLTAARTSCIQAKSVAESAGAENQLSGMLKTVFAVAENYPELKANQNFLQMQQRISYLESQIADRREFYNDAVNNYNIRIKMIPDTFIASALNYQPKEYFKVSEDDRKDPEINFNLPK